MATAHYGQGTVVPNSNFNAEQAAQLLRKAMKGLGTDEQAIINCLTSHSNEQRREIEKMFKTAFGKDLRSELKSELSGKFEDAVLALFDAPRMFDIKEIQRSIKGAGTDEASLIEILCSRSNAEIVEIKQLYKLHFKKDLEKEIVSETSGHFKRVLVSQLQANRDESNNVDQARAQQEAQELYKAGAAKLGTDESEFNRILCTRSWAQLHATFQSYAQQYGKPMDTVIRSETSGDLQESYLAIARLVTKGRPGYFAERLYKSMKGAGTNDRALIRQVVSRSEIDMVQIKEEFQKEYKKTLGSFIKGDCSGDYKKILLALIGER